MEIIVTNEVTHEIQVLKQHIENATTQLKQQEHRQSDEGMGSLIYLGNHQDAIPRELIQDPILKSNEIHTWMLMKIHVVTPTNPSFLPSQNDLMSQLKCSRPVFSRNLQVLRALRWITLCSAYRDKKNNWQTVIRGVDGHFKGSIYAQHDRPISLQDTLFLDPSYIEFMEEPSKGPTLERLRQIKDGVLQHMDYQVSHEISLDGQSGYLEQATKGLSIQGNTDPLKTHLACPPEIFQPNNCLNLYTKKKKTSKMDHVKNIDMDNSNHKNYVKNVYTDNKISQPASERDYSHVKNIDMANDANVVMDTKCCSSFNETTGNRRFPNKLNNKNKKTTTTGNLRFPKELSKSKRLQRYAIEQIEKYGVLDKDQQYILDWLSDRIKAGESGADKIVANPIGFLSWVAKNHAQGTLPPSSYGIRESKENMQNKQKKPVINKQNEIEAWARNLENMGIRVDRETQTIIKNQKVTG